MEIVNGLVARFVHFGNKAFRKNSRISKNPARKNKSEILKKTNENQNKRCSTINSKLYNDENLPVITRTVIRSEATIRFPLKEEQYTQTYEPKVKPTFFTTFMKEKSIESTYTADCGFNTDEIEEITKKFHELDNDKLTKQQFIKLYNELRSEDAERLEKISEIVYKAFDVDKDGLITLDEFLTGYSVTNYAKLNKKLDFLFKLYDRNDEGYLYTTDIGYVIEAMICLLDAELMLDANTIAKECVKDLDLNNDGKLSRDEFVNGLMKNYALRSLMSPFN